MQALVGLGPACTPVITIADEDKRKRHVVFKEGVQVLLFFFVTLEPRVEWYNNL